jgi:uncharacterized membrane protein (UPF0127 family)
MALKDGQPRMVSLAAKLFTALLLFVATGCHRHTADSGLPVTTMTIGDENFNLEIATSEHDQEVGLMHRDHLDADHGMIFPMAKDDVQKFWNHDVHFGLDLIFLDPSGTIVALKHMNAFSDLTCSSDVPAQYVIELNTGTNDRLHLKVGDHLSIPAEATTRPAT